MAGDDPASAIAIANVAIISAIGTFGAVAAAGITGYVAYINGRRQFIADQERERARLSALKSDIRVTVADAILLVDKTLSKYESDFKHPVELSVLKMPATLETFL